MQKGLVLKSTGSFYQLEMPDGRMQKATLKGKLRTQGIRTTNPIAVGDYVWIENSDNNISVIKSIEERKNYIIRKATNLSKESHIIASNIDHALLVVTLALPQTSPMFIDRFLVSAQAYRIPVVLVFNKIDLLDDDGKEYLSNFSQIYEKIGYKCLHISAFNSKDIEEIKQVLNGNISVLAGHSGVGKSTLINAIAPNLNLRIGAISDAHQSGKHTTTFAEMFPLDSGGYIIDTPGIRGFGLIDIKREELSHYFPEIFEHSKHCRFNNCLHYQEPNCAVRNAVERGSISYSRYNNYLNLLEDEDTKHRL